jgi:6-phosphogluconolactonase
MINIIMKTFTHLGVSSLILISLLSCSSEVSTSEKLWIGTQTKGTSEGIYIVEFNPTTGVLDKLELAVKVRNPTFINVLSDNLYAVSEAEDAILVAFSKNDSGLISLGEMPSYGRGACYIDSDRSKSFVAAANYGSGNGVVYNLLADGNFGDSLFTYQHIGSGPNENRQEVPHAHCSIFSQEGSVLYVVDLGTDLVIGYPTSGANLGQGFVALVLEPGDGPRHLIFQKNKLRAFIINELSSTIMSLTILADGTFEVIDRQTTLPQDFTQHNQCSDIQLSDDGKFLYGANRGHNSIVAFSVSENGELTLIGHTSVEGDWPRNFTLSPDERHLLVANQRSDNIVVFQRNKETGGLTFTGNQMTLSAPMCLKFE